MRNGRSMFRGQLGTLLLVSGLSMVPGMPVHAANAVSRGIERARPCSTLKVTKLGITIGIDEFKSAELESLKIEVNGDDARVEVKGSLACQTSSSAAFPGDASVRFSAKAGLNLASCAINQNSVSIQSTGGKYGFVVEATKGEVQKAVENSISEQIKTLCK